MQDLSSPYIALLIPEKLKICAVVPEISFLMCRPLKIIIIIIIIIKMYKKLRKISAKYIARWNSHEFYH